jgi:hypothetical protein
MIETLNEKILKLESLTDAEFYKEAIREAERWGISNCDYKWFLDNYITGKWRMKVQGN